MTTMTNFSATAERIGKTTSEKKAVEAMANALGSVENAIANGDTHYEGHCFIDDAEQYASEGLDSLDKRTLNHISDERIYELADEFGVHPSIVRSLYDVMPNELYDGIVTALEDMADDPDYEELFDE